jgi:hypothetical protein
LKECHREISGPSALSPFTAFPTFLTSSYSKSLSNQLASASSME